jgi:hypothetical protein
MVVDAKIISLKARAKHAADLAFPVSGVIDMVGPAGGLGAPTTAYDLRAALYAHLGDLEMNGAGNPTGRLLYGSDRIRAELLPKCLLVLRNETEAADLDQAMLARQNEFLSRYEFTTEMLAAVNRTYPAKLTRLLSLQQLVDQHHTELENAYGAEAPSVEDPTHGATIRPRTVTTVKLAGIATLQSQTTQVYDGDGGPTKQTHRMIDAPTRIAQQVGGAWQEFSDPKPTLISQQATSIVQSDEITHPRLENHMRHERLSADLLDEILAETIFALRIPNLKQMWDNELRDLDLSVRKLQLAYIDTFLMPSIDGRVTLAAKQPGESVRAGEVVTRIENPATLELVGQIGCTTTISVGQPVTVTTKNVFASSPPVLLTLTGKLTMVRGYDGESSKWNVVFEANNAATPIPIGYDFEPDHNHTTIKIG